MEQISYALEEIENFKKIKSSNFEVFDDSHFDNDGWDDGGSPAP